MFGSLIRILASLGVGVLLARLLPPEDFGIVALAHIATGFAILVTDLGLGPALVQRKSITERHVRVCHTVSVCTASLLTWLLVLGAAPVASFFNDARVAPVLSVSAVGLLFSGFGITANALLFRRLAFRTTVRIELLSSIVGYGGVAVALALSGFGYWSLVAGNLVQALLSSVLAYAATSHSLRPYLARVEIRELWGFSMGMSLTAIVGFFARKGDYFVVGRMLDAASLGYYTRAYTLMQLPLVFFGSALSRVLFPAAARVQDDVERFRRAYLVAMSASVAVSLPVSLAVVILSHEIILTLYGAVWAPAAPLLQILSLFGMFRMTYNTASAFVKARGQADKLLLSTVVYGILVLGGSWWAVTAAGLIGVAWATGVAITAMWVLVVVFANRAAMVTTLEFVKSLVPAVLPGLAVSAGLLGLVAVLRTLAVPPLGILLLGGVIFASAITPCLISQARSLNNATISDALEVAHARLSRTGLGKLLLRVMPL
jgi:O-antigen/teichoic acid export membrane protein